MMRFWFVSPDGTTTTFSRDAEDYKLLKRYSGLAEIPVEFQTDKSPYQHGTTLLPDGCLMTEREVSFDILIMAPPVGTIISEISAGSVNTTSVFGDAVFGDMIFGNGDTYEEGVTIGYSANLDGLQKLISALSRALSPIDGPGTLYYEREDGTTYRLTCSLNRIDQNTSDKGRSDVHQLATLSFTAHDPFWYSGTPNLVDFGISSTSFFPFSIPWSIHRGSSNRKSLLNAGNAPAPVNITIWGPITDPIITRITNPVALTGEALSIDLAMVAGDRFDITTGHNRITALFTPTSTGIPVNGQGYITIGSKFWLLQKGINDIRFSCSTSAAGSGASVSWSDQYAGVF